MEYQEFKREVGKDAARALGILFIGLPLGIFIFVSIAPRLGAMKTLLGFFVLALAVGAYTTQKR